MTPARPRSRADRLLRRPWSFRQQIVVLTAAVTAVGMLLLTLVLQVVLARISDSDVDRVLQSRADAAIAAIRASSSSGGLTVPDATLDAGVAVFDSSGELVAGATPRRLEEAYEDLAETRRPAVRDTRGPSRVRAQPFTLDGGMGGVVVVTERLGPYEEAESLALITSLVTGAIATGVAAAIAAWTVRRALRPVAEMAATAAEWSEHDLARRFALGPPTHEISALAATLDTLLEKVSAAIRSEQRLTAELAHELRTPLTSIQGTADLMLLRDGARLGAATRADLAEISAAGRRMAATITTLVELARTEASVVASASSRLPDVVTEVVQQADPDAGRTPGSPSATVDVDLGDVRLALPHALAVRTVAPVVENALRFARSRVTISHAVRDGMVEVVVADDGPGLDAALTDEVFEPGRTSGTGSGAGLGLAIARRIARTAGGDVLVPSPASSPSTPPPSGGRFVVRLPVA